MVFTAPAKINLALNIIRKRDDGYHEVDMILQSVNLADELEMEVIPQGIELTCDREDIPLGSKNLVWQAAELLQKECGVTQGVRIHLKKVIPAEAGLAGGSADCAATLRGLNELWGLNLSVAKLEDLGAKLGSDISFCISGGTARGQGRGEILTTLTDCPEFQVLLVKPRVGVSTGAAYQGFADRGVVKPPDIEGMIRALRNQDRDEIRKLLGNVFEEWIPDEKPIVREIIDELKKVGAKGVGMSGSGPTVFALGDTASEVQKWKKAVEHLGDTWICQTLTGEKE